MKIDLLKEKLEKLTGKKIKLTEAVDKEQIKSLLKSKKETTMFGLLADLGITPTNPPNSQQVAVFMVLKKMLSNGEVTRDKVGKSFVYKMGSGSPSSVKTAVPIPTKSVSTPSQALKKIDSNKYITKLDKLISKVNEALVKRGYKGNLEVRNDGINNIYFDLPDKDQDSWSKTGRVKYYYDGINKGKYTLTPKRESEKLLVANDIKDLLPPKKTSSELKREALIKSIPQILNRNWNYSGTWEGQGGKYFSLSTEDRGPRTDHGGGDDGDGWMSNDQIRRVAAPYEKKWMPRLKEFVQKLKANKIKVSDYRVDYGEKGHIALDLTIDI